MFLFLTICEYSIYSCSAKDLFGGRYYFDVKVITKVQAPWERSLKNIKFEFEDRLL